MNNNDNLSIIILIGILATATIMSMVYLLSTKVGPTVEVQTITPGIDLLTGKDSESTYIPK